MVTVCSVALINPGSNAVRNPKLVADSLTLHFFFMGNCCCHSAHDYIGNKFFNVLSKFQHGRECCFSVSASCKAEILFGIWGIEADRNSVDQPFEFRGNIPLVDEGSLAVRIYSNGDIPATLRLGGN